MSKKPVYPLQQVLQVKLRRVDEAERVVKEREQELEREEKKLRKIKEARDKVLHHRDEKLAQLRHALDTGTTAPKVKQMKQYLEIVNEKLEVEEKKVAEQLKQVEQAERNLTEAKAILKQCRLEVDKLETHEQDWQRQTRKEQRAHEARQEAELGSLMHAHRKRQEK